MNCYLLVTLSSFFFFGVNPLPDSNSELNSETKNVFTNLIRLLAGVSAQRKVSTTEGSKIWIRVCTANVCAPIITNITVCISQQFKNIRSGYDAAIVTGRLEHLSVVHVSVLQSVKLCSCWVCCFNPLKQISHTEATLRFV